MIQSNATNTSVSFMIHQAVCDFNLKNIVLMTYKSNKFECIEMKFFENLIKVLKLK